MATMFDLILRGQRELSRELAVEAKLPASITRMLGLSIAGLVVHGAVVGACGNLGGHAWLWMPLALNGAMLGGLCICLPSFYFYTQLSGLDASFRLVTAQALRAQATTSVLLLGALPFYAAWVLLIVALGADPSNWVTNPDVATSVGVWLPFVVGLFGVRQVYRGFKDLVDVVPITHKRRGGFLTRMVLAWGAVYSAVAVVALIRLAEALKSAL